MHSSRDYKIQINDNLLFNFLLLVALVYLFSIVRLGFTSSLCIYEHAYLNHNNNIVIV